jgi:zinc transport system permease protein
MIMALWDHAIAALPFSWASYEFMRRALLAVLVGSPLFGVLGTMVVGQRLVFFTDVLGHAALTGIALGVLLGAADPTVPMVVFIVLLAVLLQACRRWTQAATDTVLGVFFAFVVALGVVLLSRGGNFSKYAVYLIGDILTVTPKEIATLLVLAAGVFVFWWTAGNALVLTGVDAPLARSRGVRTFAVEIAFTVLVALVVGFSIRLVGLLIINSWLVLPAAASRLVAHNVRGYTAGAVAISVVSGVGGLIASFYWGTAAGATIVLGAAFIYVLLAVRQRRQIS